MSGGTSKPVMKSVDQFLADYQPIYKTIAPLVMKKSQQYDSIDGVINFKRIEAVGDIRPKQFTPKDNIVRRITVGESQKTFKKFHFGNQFVLSHKQDQGDVNDVARQVLDEHFKMFDENLLTGEGTSVETVVNNGLYWSADPNYELETSYEVPSGDTRLYMLHKKVIEDITTANAVDGQKIIVFYGSNITPLYNDLYTNAVKPWKQALREVIGSNYSDFELPVAVTPSGAQGYMIVNLDQIKTHFVTLPKLAKNGSNDELGYNWWNFEMGSSMVEVLAKYGIVRRPLTLAG